MSLLLVGALWVAFVSAVVRVVVDYWPVFAALALLVCGAGFTFAQDKRLREQCAREGHCWQASESGLRCLRCWARVW